MRDIDQQPGKTFEDGIKEAVATCLCSPRFLFRAEIQPEPNTPDKVVLLDEFILAARLSFFPVGIGSRPQAANPHFSQESSDRRLMVL